MAAQQEAKTTKVVKYVGTADERVIRKGDWSSIDVKDQELVRWDRKNKWTVPASELSKDALQYLDEQDSGFVVTEV